MLTASGGPFRTASAEQIRTATPSQAVAHPKWDMGAKISVNSATLMNKGLELIEAHYLFGLPSCRHRRADPSPVGGALTRRIPGRLDSRATRIAGHAHPDRLRTRLARKDEDTRSAAGARGNRRGSNLRSRTSAGSLLSGWPAKRWKRAARHPLVLNAANEVAVASFLEGAIQFPEIPRLVEEALEGTGPCARVHGGGLRNRQGRSPERSRALSAEHCA